MAPKDEDLTVDPPASVDPYEVLGIDKTATADQVKSAYRKAALKHHPDKVSAEAKTEANQRFGQIAFAYAILSDERRRARYDTTGRVSESLDVDDEFFNWGDFYREQWADAISSSALEEFSAKYKDSDEERRDILASYDLHSGNMDGVFEEVMLSNPIDDEERFRAIIDAAIEVNDVPAHKAYTKESHAKRASRYKRARREAAEAIDWAKELGVHDELFGKSDDKKSKRKGKDGDAGGEDALKALIQQKQQSRSESFLDNLEKKYGGKPDTKKKGRKRGAGAEADEPPEEAFQKMAERGSCDKKAKSKAEAGHAEASDQGTGRKTKKGRTHA